MTDIVERLRAGASHLENVAIHLKKYQSICDMAAALERIRARHTELMSKVIASDQGPTMFNEAADRIEALEAALREAKDHIVDRDDSGAYLILKAALSPKPEEPT